MSLIQQELQDLKIQLESEGKHKHVAGETKIIRKIDFLKEQFRELLVESRQRRAAEQENAMILSEDDPVNYSSVKCFLLIRLSLVTTCGKTSVATVPWSFEITLTHIRPLFWLLLITLRKIWEAENLQIRYLQCELSSFQPKKYRFVCWVRILWKSM